MKTSALDLEIRRRIDEFTDDLARTVKLATLQAVYSQLGSRLGSQGDGPALRTTPPSTPKRRGRAARRSPADVANTGEVFLAYVTQHEGQRLEQIAKGLSIASKDLAYPVVRLVAAKKLATKGQKRGTTYFVR